MKKKNKEIKIKILAELHLENLISVYAHLISFLVELKRMNGEIDPRLRTLTKSTLKLIFDTSTWLLKQKQECETTNGIATAEHYGKISQKDIAENIKRSRQLLTDSKDYEFVFDALRWRMEVDRFEFKVFRKLSDLIGKRAFAMKVRELPAAFNILRFIKKVKQQGKSWVLVITGAEHAKTYEKIFSAMGYDVEIIWLPKTIQSTLEKNNELRKEFMINPESRQK